MKISIAGTGTFAIKKLLGNLGFHYTPESKNFVYHGQTFPQKARSNMVVTVEDTPSNWELVEKIQNKIDLEKKTYGPMLKGVSGANHVSLSARHQGRINAMQEILDTLEGRS